MGFKPNTNGYNNIVDKYNVMHVQNTSLVRTTLYTLSQASFIPEGRRVIN